MIKKACKEDGKSLTALAKELWPSSTLCELEADFQEAMESEDTAYFIKYAQNVPVGFAQCQLRHDYVEGTNCSPVGYLEGVYVQEPFRRLGVAKELLHACEMWAKGRGCSAFASDCELGNADSQAFHLAMGFQEANRIVCFCKEL